MTQYISFLLLIFLILKSIGKAKYKSDKIFRFLFSSIKILRLASFNSDIHFFISLLTVQYQLYRDN